MTKLEAVKIANTICEYYKMPVARRGMVDAYVESDASGRDLLSFAIGSLQITLDVETLDLVDSKKRNLTTVEEIAPSERGFELVKK